MPDDKNLQKDVLIDDDRLLHDYPDDEEPEEGYEDSVFEEKEKLDKQTQKELKKRVDAVDKEINNAETPKPEVVDGEGKKAKIDGYNTPVVKIGEKLILPEPSDALNEAVPKELMPEYKKRYDPNDARTMDFQRSEFEEISPEEALALVKNDEPEKVLLIIAGKAVKIDKNRSGNADWRNGRLPADKTYFKKSGEAMRDTAYIGYKHLIAVADKIYKADEVRKDPDMMSQRALNPESPNADFSRPGNAPQVQNQRNAKDGVKSYWSEVSAANLNPLNTGWYRSATRKLQRYKNRAAEMKKILDSNPDDGWAKIELQTAEREIENAQRALRNGFGATKTKNDSARLRYYASEQDLSKKYNEYSDAKRELKDGQRRAASALNNLNRAKTQGSSQTINAKRQIERYEEELKTILRRLANAQMELDMADENDKAAIDAAQKEYDEVMAKVSNSEDIIKRLLGKE